MYKVGVMMMGKEGSKTPAKVKEVILEVEAKTKISNVSRVRSSVNIQS